MHVMKLLRFSSPEQSGWGILDGKHVQVANGCPYQGTLRPTTQSIPLQDIHWLPPATPSKIVCIGSNYRQHCLEMGRPVPDTPKLFLKPPSALIGNGQHIRLPPGVGRVDFEGELAIIVGRRATRITPKAVSEYLLGFTILNDVTARELQRKDVQFTRAKGFDTFCPVGPWLVPGIEPDDLRIQTHVNNTLRQDSSTADMVFSVRKLVSFISQVMTLEPGDIISTGTPSGVGPLEPGDTVAVTIEKIGTLTNVVEGT